MGTLAVWLILAVCGYFLWKTFSRRRHTPQVAEWSPDPDAFEVAIVGESYYQKALEKICGGRTENGVNKHFQATLILDDGNPYDNKAVRVAIDGQTVGHLSRENAREYRRQLEKVGDANKSEICDAVVVGGWDRGRGDRGHFGVRIYLPKGG